MSEKLKFPKFEIYMYVAGFVLSLNHNNNNTCYSQGKSSGVTDSQWGFSITFNICQYLEFGVRNFTLNQYLGSVNNGRKFNILDPQI